MTKEEILQYIKSELDNNENAEIYLDVDDYKIIIEALEQQNKILQILDDYELEAWEVLEMIKEVVRV